MERLDSNEYLKGIVTNLPESPGVYQYLNAEGTIIYVGKAKNLKRRVYSYFSKEQLHAKTRILVSKIADIRYIVVNTEEDALLLENNLIKKYKPRYNVLLKDDKSYPSICLTAESYPRVYKTRKIVRDGSTYFGPYSHVESMYAILELIRKVYRLRTCRHPLTPETVAQGKYKVCLDYHIKKCKAPCVGIQSHEEYMQDIADIRTILRGDTSSICSRLMQTMQALAEEMRFEEAQAVKEKYDVIEAYRSRSEVIPGTKHDIDVFSIETEGQDAYINYLHVTAGCINQAFTFEYKMRLEETREELLQLGIAEMRERYGSRAREIVVPFPLDMEMDGITFTVPQRGEKHHLLQLSQLNVKQYRADRVKQAEKLNPEQRSVRLMREIQEALHLDRLPMHIECFDNSNIQGSDPVAACVVFKKAKPSKADYRKYNIKTVTGPDDYASMQEVVSRRYSRLLEEGGELPDLILTDGGKGQMEVVREVIVDQLHLNIPIVGLAKNARHRTSEVLYGFPPQTVGIKQGTPLFHLLENIQDEVHRFAITFHRDKRSKSQTASVLDTVPGIGPVRKTELLKRFKSVRRIKEATLEELAAVVGEAAAKSLKQVL